MPPAGACPTGGDLCDALPRGTLEAVWGGCLGRLLAGAARSSQVLFASEGTCQHGLCGGNGGGGHQRWGQRWGRPVVLLRGFLSSPLLLNANAVHVAGSVWQFCLVCVAWGRSPSALERSSGWRGCQATMHNRGESQHGKKLKATFLLTTLLLPTHTGRQMCLQVLDVTTLNSPAEPICNECTCKQGHAHTKHYLV